MTRRRLLVWLLLGVVPTLAQAQTYTPQSPAGLSVTFHTERAGGSRVILFGEVANSTNAPCQRVSVLAEGLDESGRVISRSRGFVYGTIPARGTASFEIRLLAAGSEKRYRVQIESFEFLVGN